jgi:hypothetical protein
MEVEKQIREIIEFYCGGTYENRNTATKEILQICQALQLQQTGVMRCSSKDIDKFYDDTMYTDQTNYYGVIQRTKKGDFVRWKQPSQMIKDFIRWKKNNA